MREVAERYGLAPNRAGFISCPFHNEKTPSLKIYTEPGRGFHCYGCQTGGSVIDFVMELFGISFNQALVRMNADFGLNVLSEKPDREQLIKFQKAQAKKKQLARQRKQKINRLAAEHCQGWQEYQEKEPFSDEWCQAVTNLTKINIELEVMGC